MKLLSTFFAFFLTLSSVIANPAWYESTEGIDNVAFYLQKNYVQKARKIYESTSKSYQVKIQQIQFAHQDYKACTFVIESEKECYNHLQSRLFSIKKDASDNAAKLKIQIQNLISKKEQDTTFVAPENSDAEFVLMDIESELRYHLENTKSLLRVLE